MPLLQKYALPKARQSCEQQQQRGRGCGRRLHTRRGRELRVQLRAGCCMPGLQAHGVLSGKLRRSNSEVNHWRPSAVN
mgnify:CR=1 FL=1